MIVAGFHSPDAEYSKLLEALWKECGIPVLCEAQSNVVGISAAGSLKTMQDNPDIARRAEEYCPELVVSVGGSVLSKALKNYIRNSDGIREHWYIGYSDHAIDCYGRLSRRFNIDCKVFLRALYRKFMHRDDVDYVNLWNTLSGTGETHIAGFINRLPWCGLKAVRLITDVCGSNDTSLHVSNGMAVRHVQFCDFQKWKSVECNRGVSGIDGSTSTAIGAALAGGRILLVSGDMSAQYDIGALAIDAVPDNFRMIVLDNGGGGIFRVIGSTENIDPTIRERYYSGNINLPLANLARAFGYGYFEVDSEESFRKSCPDFLACDRKAIMRIVVD
ncbi:MAG: hypothetical protein K2G24_07660 [Muribaculaceae bacterium]|nr:hypothetical protein [Muribaculaceae bacterium]